MIGILLVLIGAVATVVGILDNLIFHQSYLTWLDTFYVASLTYIMLFKKEHTWWN